MANMFEIIVGGAVLVGIAVIALFAGKKNGGKSPGAGEPGGSNTTADGDAGMFNQTNDVDKAMSDIANHVGPVYSTVLYETQLNMQTGGKLVTGIGEPIGDGETLAVTHEDGSQTVVNNPAYDPRYSYHVVSGSTGTYVFRVARDQVFDRYAGPANSPQVFDDSGFNELSQGNNAFGPNGAETIKKPNGSYTGSLLDWMKVKFGTKDDPLGYGGYVDYFHGMGWGDPGFKIVYEWVGAETYNKTISGVTVAVNPSIAPNPVNTVKVADLAGVSAEQYALGKGAYGTHDYWVAIADARQRGAWG